MLLTGHAGEVFTCKFNPMGDVIASGSHDKHIFLWRTYGECENFMMMKGEPSPRLPSSYKRRGFRLAAHSQCLQACLKVALAWLSFGTLASLLTKDSAK